MQHCILYISASRVFSVEYKYIACFLNVVAQDI